MSYCPDEFGYLNRAMDGLMGLILSSWDNRDERQMSIETANRCQITSSCSTSMATFSEVSIMQWGSNEDIYVPPFWEDLYPEPEP